MDAGNASPPSPPDAVDVEALEDDDYIDDYLTIDAGAKAPCSPSLGLR
jgi:hypothetical protein